MEIFWYKLLISILLSVSIFFLIVYKEKLLQIIDLRQFKHFFISFVVFRLLPFWVVYIYLNYDTTSDVNIFYSSALSSIHGGVVYRDFPSVYSPFFPYISGLFLFFWQSPKAIVLMMIVVEGFALWGTIKLFNKNEICFMGMVYFLLPTTFIFVIFGGQEDVWMWGGIVASIHIYKRFNSQFWFGAALALGLLVSKLIFVLVLPSIFLVTDKKKQFVFGFLSVFVPVTFVLFNWVGWALLSPIQEANIPRTPNLISLVRPFTNEFIPLGWPLLNWLGLVVNFALGLYWVVLNKNKYVLEVAVVKLFLLTYVLIMLLQQSSYSNYVFLFAMPYVFFVSNQFDSYKWAFFLILNLLSAIHPAYWWHNGMFYIQHVADLKNSSYLIEYIFEIIIVFGLFWLIKQIHSAELISSDRGLEKAP
jgi:hypothetical protein